MSNDESGVAIQQGFEQTNFEMVATGANDKYELPVSEAARYRLEKRLDPALLQNTLERRDYSFIAPYSELNYLSSKVYDAETNEFLHVKLNGDLLRVFPKDETLSLETFRRFVECVNKNVAALDLEANDAE